jgi:hypothetical protein
VYTSCLAAKERSIFEEEKKMKTKVLAVIVCMMAAVNFASADNIRGININFVTIGNPGNAADTFGRYGCGAVSYGYRIGRYEVTNAQWNTFTAAAGAPMGNPSEAYDQDAYFTGAQQPTSCISWYEAAQFCNYLTSGDKSLGAYQLGDGTIMDDCITVDRAAAISSYGTVYVIPTIDEWYKAAYYKPDGSGYSGYANGQYTIPAADSGWNYYGGAYIDPWNVGTGTIEQNGTFDMMGNVFEWNEDFAYGTVRGLGGGHYLDSDFVLSSGCISGQYPFYDDKSVGFRVASVPEPCSLVLLSIGGLVLRRKK